jgi:hypothetical protein
MTLGSIRPDRRNARRALSLVICADASLPDLRQHRDAHRTRHGTGTRFARLTCVGCRRFLRWLPKPAA